VLTVSELYFQNLTDLFAPARVFVMNSTAIVYELVEDVFEVAISKRAGKSKCAYI